MSSYYKAGQTDVPKDFLKPSPSFKRHVFLAMLALGFFVIIYTGLMLYFGVHAYNLFQMAGGDVDYPVFTVIAGICLAFISFFMLKSLFIFGNRRESTDRVITENDEPELVSFINQLADEAGAPRPHKIILSSRVNASVFYDLSIFNLLFPSKKNLEIGLGLVNVLNIGEFKAILAHEFGHFAQRSMLLGRYVYTAQQVAERVVSKRDWLDNILSGISSFDLRIAWIGWILSIIVWAIRSLIEVLFGVVVVAERALSREMEFQADNVAVSLTGSDALVHALHKLRAADEGYRASMDAINDMLRYKKAVPDMFTLQTNHIEKMRWILNDENFGESPEVFSEMERVFSNRIVNPPEMWATHPADLDRENNAKRIYIRSEIDNRPAWKLFTSPEKLRKQITADLIKTANVETTIVTEEESVTAMNEKEYEWSFLHPKYKGAFLTRYSFTCFKSAKEAYSVQVNGDLAQEYKSLYPDSIKETLERLKEVGEEIQQLTIVRYEPITAERRVIMHRGQPIKRKQIPGIISGLKKEEQSLRDQLVFHDQHCRAVNYQAAKSINPEIGEYLLQLASLVHYAEHSIRDIEDVARKFRNTLNVILADGRVTNAEREALLKDCNNVHYVLKGIYQDAAVIRLDDTLVRKLGRHYQNQFSKYELGKAQGEYLNEWVNNVEGWVNQALYALNQMRNVALERLLDVEEQVKESYLSSKTLDVEIGEIKMVEEYSILMPGSERKIQHKLKLWDRFHAGIGLFPNIAKFSVSAGIIAFAIWMGDVTQHTEVHIYNGLGTSVYVEIDGESYLLSPYDNRFVEVDFGDQEIVATTEDGEVIEEYYGEMDDRSSTYIYSVGAAAYFYEYTASYDRQMGEDETHLGPIHWVATNADYILKDAPESIYAYSYLSSERTAIAPWPTYSPYTIPNIFEPNEANRKMIEAHLKWDDGDSEDFLAWLTIASEGKGTKKLIEKRLERFPNEVSTNRFLQDHTEESNLAKMRKHYKSMFDKDSKNPNAYYLMVRAMPNGPKQDSMFIAGSDHWPMNSWLAISSGYAYAGNEQWEDAYLKYEKAIRSSALKKAAIKELERLFRRAEVDNPDLEENAELYKDSWVKYHRKLEHGQLNILENNFDKAYHLLANGDMQATLTTLSSYDLLEREPFYWFVLGSDNAPEELAEVVLSYNVSKTGTPLNRSTMLGVLAKYDKSYDQVLDALSDDYDLEEWELKVVKLFVEDCQNGRLVKAKERLNKLDNFYVKTNCKLIARIILGKRVPSVWDTDINRLLFITERPYFEER